MESGHTRAASMMNAAMRSRFVERIQKYEAKVRQGKGFTKEPRDLTERKPRLGKEEQQQASVAEKMMIPEKVLPAEVGYGENGLRQQQVRGNSQKKAHNNEREELLHERALHNFEKGFLSDKDSSYKRHGRENSPENRVFPEQKEMISGMLQRSSSLSSSRLNNFDVVDMATGVVPMSVVSEKLLPAEMMHLQLRDRIYEEVKHPPRLRIDIEAIACELRIRLKAADMPLPMQEHAFRCARECLDNIGKGQSKLIAHTLKKEFDDDYGPAWHCIVGTSFGSFVTHSLGGFVYFSLDKVSVLLFKTTVEPLENSR